MKTYTADEEEMIDELLAVGVAETVNLYDSDQLVVEPQLFSTSAQLPPRKTL